MMIELGPLTGSFLTLALAQLSAAAFSIAVASSGGEEPWKNPWKWVVSVASSIRLRGASSESEL